MAGKSSCNQSAISEICRRQDTRLKRFIHHRLTKEGAVCKQKHMVGKRQAGRAVVLKKATGVARDFQNSKQHEGRGYPTLAEVVKKFFLHCSKDLASGIVFGSLHILYHMLHPYRPSILSET